MKTCFKEKFLKTFLFVLVLFVAFGIRLFTHLECSKLVIRINLLQCGKRVQVYTGTKNFEVDIHRIHELSAIEKAAMIDYEYDLDSYPLIFDNRLLYISQNSFFHNEEIFRSVCKGYYVLVRDKPLKKKVQDYIDI